MKSLIVYFLFVGAASAVGSNWLLATQQPKRRDFRTRDSTGATKTAAASGGSRRIEFW
jgi:hypothetical protein